jgi:hypothetical protein
MVLEMQSSWWWTQKSPNWETIANNIKKLCEVVNKILDTNKFK